MKRRRLKRRHRGFGDTFSIDEVFVIIKGKQHYLWRAVDQYGEVIDVYLQAKRDGAVANSYFRRLLRSHSGEPSTLVIHAAMDHWMQMRVVFEEIRGPPDQLVTPLLQVSRRPRTAGQP